MLKVTIWIGKKEDALEELPDIAKSIANGYIAGRGRNVRWDVEKKGNDKMELEGKKIVSASRHRLTPENFPNGYHYQLRHDDNFDKPCTIEKVVTVNHFGDVILDSPLEKLEDDLHQEKYVELSVEDQAMILAWIEMWGEE